MNQPLSDALTFLILTSGAVLIVIQIGRLLRTTIQHKTIRQAISRDNQSVPALLAGIHPDQQAPTGANDDRTGFVLIAIGLALFLFGLIQGDPQTIRSAAGAALFPSFVGAALLIRFHLVRRRERQR